MQLHRLELHGFKSFADRTEFTFDPGITGLVGPNGCGKSNVVDAIKWTLGSQSAKNLRGEEMLDVIFNGSSTRPAQGYAEVSLTFANGDHRLPIDYDEVTVTRRLYRSGESEYLLNRQACRLKDIRELFLDTGIGVQNYSIIEQGKIDLLIQSSPRDRRTVFEEAAGISKYRAKRREAEVKLEHVRQDLLRLGDILKELAREIRSLKIQAGRAARWVTVSRQWKEKRLALARIQYRALSTERQATVARIAELEALQAETQAKLRLLAEEATVCGAKLTELSARASVVEAARASAEERARGLTNRHADETRRIEDLAQEARRVAEDEGRARADIELLATRRAQNAAAITEAQGDLARTAEELAREEQLLAEFARGCAEMGRALDAKKQEGMDVLRRQSGYQNELTGIASDRKNLLAHQERVAQRAREIEAERAQIAQRVVEVRQALDEARAALDDLERRHREEEEALARCAEEVLARDGSISHLRDTLARKQSRHDLLADLERHREGVGCAVKEVLAANLPGVRGVLADFLEVPLDAVACVEAALGERAQMVVCEREEDALRVAAFARDLGKGRVAAIAPVEHTPGARGGPRVMDLLRWDPFVASIVESLLGRCRVVRTLDEALFLRSFDPSAGPWVTPGGELVEGDGPISAGAQAGSAGLIGRRTELRALAEEIQALSSSLEAEENARTAVIARRASHEEALKDLRTRIYETKVLLMDRERDQEALAKRGATLQDEQEVNVLDLADMGKQLALLREREHATQRILSELTALSETIQAEVARQTEELARAEERRQALAARVTDLKVARATAKEKLDHLTAAAEGLAREEAQATERLASLATRALEVRERRERAQEGLLVIGRDLEAARAELGAREREAGELLVAKDAVNGKLKDLRERSQGLEREVGERGAQVQELRLTESGQRINLENLRQRVRDDLAVDLEAPEPEPAIDPTTAELASLAAEAEGESPAAGEAGAPSRQPAAPDDPVALQAEIDELRRKLDVMGQVNMTALDELKERQGRMEVFTRQEKDLQDALQQLEELIRKLNRESRDRFEATLAMVRENFNGLFRKLFGGGKADLVMEEGVDVLETGIDIVARPPGKELNSISLLSGGEKALTTLGLVMAIFLLKPSPFCVLDEVDAPLDEKNIDRFLALLSEFTSQTQFLVITHNKRTMAMTNILYGVTMQEAGVSRKVSVKMVDEVDPILAAAPNLSHPNGMAR